MPVDVKICGLKTAPTMEAALAAGADYVGLNFYGPSPRSVDIVTAHELSEMAHGRTQVVALFVDPEDALVELVATNVRPDVVQLHGGETPERVAEIRKMTGARMMKAIKVRAAKDVKVASQYDGVADLILFDAKAPPEMLGGLPGGNGEVFDWRLLEAYDCATPWMLSGGLSVDTVAAAIAQTGAKAVDVASGVERPKGEKDVQLITQFVAAAKSAVPALEVASE